MTAFSFNIFISVTIYLGFILQPSHGISGFKVIQPQYQAVNSDGSVCISCEHSATTATTATTATAAFTVEDVRLNGISTNSTQSLLCQKGMEFCGNVILHKENLNKWLFIILNIGPEAMGMKYQCEFTLKKEHKDYTSKGVPTKLLPGNETCETPPPPPPPPQPLQLLWILIVLLALMVVYSFVITTIYIRLKVSNNGPDNTTYVVMKKAPVQRSPPSHTDFL